MSKFGISLHSNYFILCISFIRMLHERALTDVPSKSLKTLQIYYDIVINVKALKVNSFEKSSKI